MLRFPAIEKAILRRRTPLISGAWAIVSVAAPTGLRWIIDRGEAGVPFVTYFPAVVLAALFLGGRWATVTAVFSAVIGNRVFRPNLPINQFDMADLIMTGLFALSCAILINMGVSIRRLLNEAQAGREREKFLNEELRHRVRNLLTVVQALAETSFRTSDPGDFLRSFSDRINALAKAADLVTSSEQHSQDIQDVIKFGVAAFRSESNFHFEGSKITVPSSVVVSLALIIHELCTNAVKYGSLSNPQGYVVIEWGLVNETTCRIHWREIGGPTVVEPNKAGMGSKILRAGAGLSKVDMTFEPEGLKCVIELSAQ